MSNVLILERDQSEQILQQVIQERVSAILTYKSRNKWHVAKVVLGAIKDQVLCVEPIHPDNRYYPITIREGQPIGISFKYAYGKFVFETLVKTFSPTTDRVAGGTIELAFPDHIRSFQRRSYFRVNVPTSLKVNVTMWHRSCKPQLSETDYQYHQGQLVDLSAGGAQIAMSKDDFDKQSSPDKPLFRKGQFIGLRFTPMPYETPLMFNAQIRNILPTADDKALCLGIQIVGLEASPEGLETLARIAQVVERYHLMNQDPTKRNLSETTETQVPKACVS